MTGAQFARIVKVEFPGMPIVLASGYAQINPEDTELCDYRLTKPFSSGQLKAVLVKWMMLLVRRDNFV